MTTITPFLTAQVVSLSSSRIFAGKGCVEKAGNDGQVVISSAAGKMTVKLTSGILAQGDNVAFKVSGNQIFMERIEAASDQSLPEDVFELFRHNNRADIQSMVKELAKKTSDNPVSSNTQDELTGALTLLEKKMPDFDPQVRASAQELIKYASPMLTDPASSQSLDFSKCTDLIKKLSESMESASAPAVTSFQADSKAQSPAAGFYYFDSLDKALSWAQTTGAQIEGKDIVQLNAIFSNSPVTVQLDCDGSVLQYSFMSIEKAAAEIQSFIQNNIKSSLGNELTPDLLMLLMIQRGYLPVNRLLEVDTLFPDTGLESILLQEPGQSACFQPDAIYGASLNKNAIVLEQWLNIVCDPETPLNILPGHIPLFSSTAIPEMFETTTKMQSPGATSAFTGLDIKDFTITDSLFNTNETKGLVIPSILNKMGMDFENSLSAISSDDAAENISPNLKSSLLTALNEFRNGIITKNVEAMETLQKAISPVTDIMQQLLAQKNVSISQQTQNGLNMLQQEVNNKINDWVRAADSMVTEAITGTAGQTQSASVNTLPSDGSASATTLQSPGNMTGKIDALTRSIVKQMFLQLETASNDISLHIQKLSEYSIDKISNETLNDVLNAIKGLSAQLERTAGGIPWRFDRVIMEATRLLDASQGNISDKSANVSTDAMNNRLEAMLSRVESLQILAKPVTTSQGEQHVLMLPMKIDGKWDDVIVKFVKNGHKGGKKASKRNISVTINVAPTFLGEINTTMEYSPQRNLKLCMNFASEKTRSWFENKKKDFTEAIGKPGFKSLQIVLKKLPRHEKTLTVSSAKKTNDGCIDIVV
ncbi:MAG TPA: hypothetical protein DCO75_02335 [Fibrobacteres bacterium]|nr:hypothetical protein [Fibrobacterota bacterium]